jgi:hypothetical protein
MVDISGSYDSKLHLCSVVCFDIAETLEGLYLLHYCIL